MVHAILFFKDCKSKELDAGINFNNLLIEANNGIPSKISKALQHIFWWINKTIAFLSHERCSCVRKIQIKDSKELDYYEPGHVFRIKNIVSAHKVESHKLIKYEGD